MSPRRFSGVPDEPVDLPAVVRALAGVDLVTPVWRNELGGLTFRLDGPVARFVKWHPAGVTGVDLTAEAERSTWARRWTTVPIVLDQGTDASGSWLVTAALPGRSAVDPRWLAEPATAAAAIGHGLRLLHDALPVADCPYDWGVEHRLRRAGAHSPGRPPPVDRLVVCHGDACAPNTLLHDDGTVAGHVDLGRLGVADRWADIAVAARNADLNYGPGHADAVYAGYGVAPDPARIAYYRALWDAT